MSTGGASWKEGGLGAHQSPGGACLQLPCCFPVLIPYFPRRVHPFASDPETFEMVQKIQTLQKRLIQKTEEVVERELQIQQKEKQYLELKAVLARQPGPEVAEQLQLYQQTVKEKNRQLKSMASEVRAPCGTRLCTCTRARTAVVGRFFKRHTPPFSPFPLSPGQHVPGAGGRVQVRD